MKDFFKYVLATVVGLILFFLVFMALGAMSLVGMIASGESTKNVKDNTVFVLKLDGTMDERAESNILSKFSGQASEAIGLDDMLSAIEKAKDNDKIKGIYIEAGSFSPDSYASLQAIRKALLDFKKAGKWIVAYGDTYTTATYYLASTADKILINPQGTIDWHGMAAQPYFLKDLLGKFGVKMQLTKVGTYKSAPETYTSDHMSDANREQVTAYVNGIWDNIVSDVSASRKVSKEQLNLYADSMLTFCDAKEYITKKMADKLVYADEVKDEVKALLKLEKDDDINQVNLFDMGNVKKKKNEGEEIAVYYAYGNIVDSNSSSPLEAGSHLIVGKDVAKDLLKLADDDDVKAVVLRVNSGGGSAYASEQIWHAMKQLKAKKPVVVSMGGMAASGGYYISAPASYIVAEPTTITGSIGIFGLIPDMSELLTQKLGVKFDEVKTNANAGFGTMARPLNANEMAMLNTYIERGYKLFRSRVADGRKMSTEDVEKIAQGRVWLGQDALKIKLVDELGGLETALEKAAKLAKLEKYHTYSYPEKADWMSQLMNETTGDNYLNSKLKATLGELYMPFMMLKHMNHHNAVQARIPYVIQVE
ncbi:MAG: signal peptide peptidase SppA [Prevotella sp.]|nr:signal peptide peptidase SppA [Prevotella sp.]